MLVVGGGYGEFHQKPGTKGISFMYLHEWLSYLSPRKKSCTFTVSASDVATAFCIFNLLVIPGSLVVTYSISTLTFKYLTSVTAFHEEFGSLREDLDHCPPSGIDKRV